MRYNLFFDIEGPGGKLKRVANSHNPIEAVDIKDCLLQLADNDLPFKGFVRYTGVHIEEVEQ